MDGSSVSVWWCRRSKPLGKVRRRVQDLRTPSSCCSDLVAIRPVLDLSHNESARLAVDCLLTGGLKEYHKVLNAEGEADFLSELEKDYILENGRKGNIAEPGAFAADEDPLSDGSQSATQCPAVPTDSPTTLAELDQSSVKDVKWDHVLGEPTVQVYFQSDGRAAGLKDLIREFIRKAKMVLAIVMDSFTDVELLCDLLEASRKRNVSIHLLLDHLNLSLFVTMWQDLNLHSKDFPKLSVRSVDGQTYCAKTGRKLTGQVAESFIITDWTEVLTGSYSFSWLSWQVHRSLAVLIKGSAITPFHQEFHRLYSSSKPVPDFVTYITVPRTLPPYVPSHATAEDNTEVGKLKSSQAKTLSHWAWTGDAQKNTDLDCDNLATGGLCFQQRNRNGLRRPSWIAEGLEALRGPRNYSLNLNPKVELRADNPRPTSSPTKQAKTGLRFPLTSSRERTSGHQTEVTTEETRRRDQYQRHSHQPAEAPRSRLTPKATGTQPKPQFQTHPKWFSGATPNLQPHTSRQVKPLPRLNWMLQIHTARPRPVARTSSFDTTYETGQRTGGQPGGRTAPSNMNSSLRRSKSLTDRRMVGLKGAGLDQ